MTNSSKGFDTTSMDDSDDSDDEQRETLVVYDNKLRAALGFIRPKKSPVQEYSLLIYSRDGVSAAPLRDGESVVVGRAAAADVSVRDASLSRQHVALELVDGEVWVEDLQSKNGTWVNGSKISRSLLCVGDTLSIGAVTASLHVTGDSKAGQLVAENHDSFRTGLATEVYRARTFGRSLALVMMVRNEAEDKEVHEWLPTFESS